MLKEQQKEQQKEQRPPPAEAGGRSARGKPFPPGQSGNPAGRP